MADMWDKKRRSEMMSLIRSNGNKSTELRLIVILRAYGITGWRRGQPLPGKPDFVFRRERVCIFVDGCFWHGCLKCYKAPETNPEFWSGKVLRNRARDRKVNRLLRKDGWTVVRIWEHSLKNHSRIAQRLNLALNRF
ncbi:MAG: DNA mismatch endonuclease Vsr [Candidatus Hydrogenedens sp.]|nr:DNA mismatch endonuclease Vsr [Candidatus Hydrogenedens sp.]